MPGEAGESGDGGDVASRHAWGLAPGVVVGTWKPGTRGGRHGRWRTDESSGELAEGTFAGDGRFGRIGDDPDEHLARADRPGRRHQRRDEFGGHQRDAVSSDVVGEPSQELGGGGGFHTSNVRNREVHEQRSSVELMIS